MYAYAYRAFLVVKHKLLHYLACPGCQGTLRLQRETATEGTHIMEGMLACEKCTGQFPIARGIPRFASLSLTADKAATAANFGWQWQHFTQHDDLYEDQFLDWIKPVDASFFRDKLVLEGGCGKGRHTQLAANWGALDVIGVDLSDAVETAFAKTRHLENAHIVQADIYHFPTPRIFDYAFSVGVLHHLPDPRQGFLSLASRVKSGGHLSAWVYGAENNEWITRWVDPLRERITSRLNKSALLQLSKIPTALLYGATKAVYGPLNRSPRGARLAQHLFYNDYLKVFSRFGWREQHTIVFDHLVAPTAFYISRPEFESWWHDASTRDVVIEWHNKNSWRGFGAIDERAD